MQRVALDRYTNVTPVGTTAPRTARRSERSWGRLLPVDPAGVSTTAGGYRPPLAGLLAASTTRRVPNILSRASVFFALPRRAQRPHDDIGAYDLAKWERHSWRSECELRPSSGARM